MSVCKIIKKTKQCPPSSPRLKRYTADVDGFDVRRHVYLASDVEALLAAEDTVRKVAILLYKADGAPNLRECDLTLARHILALIGGTP